MASASSIARLSPLPDTLACLRAPPLSSSVLCSRTILPPVRAPPAPGFDGRVLGHHPHRPPVEATHAGHDTVGREVARHRVGEQAHLHERVVVEEQREPVAHEQLALLLELLASLF